MLEGSSECLRSTRPRGRRIWRRACDFTSNLWNASAGAKTGATLGNAQAGAGAIGGDNNSVSSTHEFFNEILPLANVPLFFEIKKTVELGWFKPESLTMNINILKQEE